MKIQFGCCIFAKMTNSAAASADEMPMRGINDSVAHVPCGGGRAPLITIHHLMYRDNDDNGQGGLEQQQQPCSERCKERCKFPWFRILLHIAFYSCQVWVVLSYPRAFGLILPNVQILSLGLCLLNCTYAPPNTQATFLQSNSLVVSFALDLVAPPVYLILMSVDVVTYDKDVMYNCIGITCGAWGLVAMIGCCFLEHWIHSSSTPPPLPRVSAA